MKVLKKFNKVSAIHTLLNKRNLKLKVLPLKKISIKPCKQKDNIKNNIFKESDITKTFLII